MPNPLEVATIVIDGQQFSTWKTVSVERSFNEIGSQAEVSVIELPSPSDSGTPDPSAAAAGSSSGASPSPAQLISVGSTGQVLLGGVQVLNGFVSMRQAVMTPEAHGLLIKILSTTILTVNSSVSATPGQFKNYTTSALANSILSPLGIKFNYGPGGPPAGAENTFERVSLNIGESILDALSRFARMRNLFLRDDENGNVVATRATGSESAVAQLTEGQNIKSGTSIFRNDTILSSYTLTGQNFGNAQHNQDNARSVGATGSAGDAQPGTSKVVNMPMPGQASDAVMHVARVQAEDRSRAFELTITVQGWFADQSNLWIQLIGQQITVVSPTLLPANYDQSAKPIYIKGVTHRQNDATGTETILKLCDLTSLGGAYRLGGDEDPPPQPAPVDQTAAPPASAPPAEAPAPTAVG